MFKLGKQEIKKKFFRLKPRKMAFKIILIVFFVGIIKANAISSKFSNDIISFKIALISVQYKSNVFH